MTRLELNGKTGVVPRLIQDDSTTEPERLIAA